MPQAGPCFLRLRRQGMSRAHWSAGPGVRAARASPSVRHHAGAAAAGAAAAGRAHHRAARPERLRQVHAAAVDERPAAPGHRPRPLRGPAAARRRRRCSRCASAWATRSRAAACSRTSPPRQNVDLMARYLRWPEARIRARLDALVELTRFPARGAGRFPGAALRWTAAAGGPHARADAGAGRCCCSTSRWARWTRWSAPSCRWTCAPSSSGWARRWCWSPMISRRRPSSGSTWC